MAMLCYKPLVLSLLTTFLFFSFSYGDSHFPNFQTLHSSGEVQNGLRRLLDEGQSDETPVNSSYLILASKRTYRRDPLNDFKRYTGGWNISERHYWAENASAKTTSGGDLTLKHCFICTCRLI